MGHRRENVARVIGGKTIEEVKLHYENLVKDLKMIEEGHFPTAKYTKATEGGCNNFNGNVEEQRIASLFFKQLRAYVDLYTLLETIDQDGEPNSPVRCDLPISDKYRWKNGQLGRVRLAHISFGAEHTNLVYLSVSSCPFIREAFQMDNVCGP
ncbi:hypothetical protein Lal_00005021 [Lupinus albus]|nr:hypothetical protein Lal_00005021 [Lupinus albus]